MSPTDDCQEKAFSVEVKTQPPTFDDIIDNLRGFGPFQWRVFLISTCLKISTAVGMFLLVFVGVNPGWTCQAAGDNVTEQTAPQEDLSIDDRCALNSSVCSHVYRGEYTSVVTEWDLVCSRDYIPSLITSVLMAGVGVGAGLIGHLADKYGRRNVLYGTACVLVLLLVLQGFAINWQTFAAVRFFMGMAIGGVVVVASVIPVEVVGRQWRVLVSVMHGWQLGMVILAGAAYLIHDWRHLCWALAAISAPFLAGWFFVPECARWLIQHGRFEEAHAVVKEMARLNGSKAPCLDELRALAETDRHRTSGVGYTYLDLFSTPAMARNTVTLMLLWFSSSIMVYGIAVNMRDFKTGVHATVVIMSVMNFTFYATLIPLVKWFGRKPVLLGFLIVAIIGAVTIAVCDNTGTFQRFPHLRMAVALIGMSSMDTCWVGGYLLVSELFPTVVRSQAMAISSIAARIGGVLAPQVAYLKFLHSSVPYAIYSALCIVVGLLILLLPETRGRPLPDALPPAGKITFCSRKNNKPVGDINYKQEVEVCLPLNSEQKCVTPLHSVS